MSITLELPLPPSSNAIWRVAGRRVILSGAAQAYKQEAALQLNLLHLEPLTGPVLVTLTCYMDKARGDLSNREKLVLDVLQGHAYVDDKQIAELRMIRRYIKGERKVIVRVEALYFEMQRKDG